MATADVPSTPPDGADAAAQAWLQQVTQSYKQALADREESTIADLVSRYYDVRAALRFQLGTFAARFERLAELAPADRIALMAAYARVVADLREMDSRFEAWSQAAREVIGDAQRAAAQLGIETAQAQLDASMPAELGRVFGLPPDSVVVSAASALSVGSPVYALFDEFAPGYAATVRAALLDGIALGQGPAAIARALRDLTQDAADWPLQRTLTIARTETMRAWRAAQSETFRANSDVVSAWQWSADFSERTCGACLAMDGTIHGLEEDMDSHINCRCAQLPVTRSWSDLLADVGVSGAEADALAPTARETGAEWFAQQAPETQRLILGPAKWGAYVQGDLQLADLVRWDSSPVWGRSLHEASLKELGLDASDYLGRNAVRLRRERAAVAARAQSEKVV